MLSLMTLDLELNMYHAAALGAALFYLGTEVVKHVPFFQTCDTLVSLLGGLLFAFLNTVLYACGLPYFTFDTTLQTVFMNLFFASIGFSFSLPSLLCLPCVFISLSSFHPFFLFDIYTEAGSCDSYFCVFLRTLHILFP